MRLHWRLIGCTVFMADNIRYMMAIESILRGYMCVLSDDYNIYVYWYWWRRNERSE